MSKRKGILKGFIEKSGSAGSFLDSVQENDMDYSSRESILKSFREGPKYDRDQLYGLSESKKDLKVESDQVQRGLSSRYSPDRVGEMLMRIGDNVYQSSITGKIYDYNEGFATEQGDVFSPSSVSNQTKLLYFAKEIASKGFIKEAKMIIDAVKNK